MGEYFKHVKFSVYTFFQLENLSPKEFDCLTLFCDKGLTIEDVKKLEIMKWGNPSPRDLVETLMKQKGMSLRDAIAAVDRKTEAELLEMVRTHHEIKVHFPGLSKMNLFSQRKQAEPSAPIDSIGAESIAVAARHVP